MKMFYFLKCFLSCVRERVEKNMEENIFWRKKNNCHVAKQRGKKIPGEFFFLLICKAEWEKKKYAEIKNEKCETNQSFGRKTFL